MAWPLHPTRAALCLLAALAIVACGDLGSAAYLPQPSPVPTLTGLPTVTPAPPTSTPAPTGTPVPATAVPTPAPLTGVLVVDARVRAGPGIDFEVVNGILQGSEVPLLAERDGWYFVTVPDGTSGWVAADLLLLAEGLVVPAATPEP